MCGLFPACFSRCLLRCTVWLNDLLHCAHLWSFTPVWVSRWVFRRPVWLNDLLHCGQLCCNFPMWLLRFPVVMLDSQGISWAMFNFLLFPLIWCYCQKLGKKSEEIYLIFSCLNGSTFTFCHFNGRGKSDSLSCLIFLACNLVVGITFFFPKQNHHRWEQWINLHF